MTAAQESLRGVLRDRLGPVLRAAGFKGSAPTWTLSSPNGDRAVVNVQSSDFSSKNEALFTVNLSIVPNAWWRRRNHQLRKNESRAVKEYDGLWRDRLRARHQQAANRPEWWSVTDDAAAQRAVDDVVGQMENGVLAQLRQLLEPGAILAAARSGHLGHASFDTRGALAVLLTENDPGDELPDLLTDLETEEDARLRSTFRPLTEWCREAIRLQGRT